MSTFVRNSIEQERHIQLPDWISLDLDKSGLTIENFPRSLDEF